MSVNGMRVEQAYTFLSALNAQATGKQTLTKITNLGEFVSVANSLLLMDREPVLKALTQVLERTLFAVRPYDSRFSGLVVSNTQFGAITRKISYADKALREHNEAWPYETAANETQLDDGKAVDPWIIWKPDILETKFYGSATWAGQYTIFEDQLQIALRGPEELAGFLEGIMTHFDNERTFWLDNIGRGTLQNLAAGKIAMASGASPIAADGVVDLGNLDGAADEAAFNELVRSAYATIGYVSDMMENRSGLYQQPTGKDIFRHTPKADQRAYINSKLMREIEARTLATTYNDSWLEMVPHKRIDYWQNIKAPTAINATGSYFDFTAGEFKTADVNEAKVVGILFDRDAAGMNIYSNTLRSTQVNPRADYYNLFAKTRVRLYNDFTEKAVVFTAKGA